jgi:hypothetical protein
MTGPLTLAVASLSFLVANHHPRPLSRRSLR